ncbi:hypothetical protein [Dyadobacter sandarakinus]|uniref:Uncharacterized protein n=1 Tax=Dyadobacter sandarakinus TaxID=2747268 RepID=A0ABX7I5C0_9BACT|nr:hypothetical protein [Dyadobacter sandarakinus]QRR00216.1 hypothetical protein HWI92_04505 [Dyadobacter sandarakinus]
MYSYKQQLAKIGYHPQDVVQYSKFFLAPRSFKMLNRSMDFPGKIWEDIPGVELDKDWTDEIQGCAAANNHWYLVSNKADSPRLLVFNGKSIVKSYNLSSVPKPSIPGFEFYHFGSILINGQSIYIDHWDGTTGGHIMEFRGDGLSNLSFVRWIPLGLVHGRVGMLAIDFEQQVVVTSGGEKDISKVYLHSLETGMYLEGKTLLLDPPIQDGCYAQGGFWSPNNHLYISSGQGGILDQAKGHQYIYSYSPLNGKLLNTIPVTTLEGRQELEGCCYADVTRGGKRVQIHAVLLENEPVAKDDIYIKSFTADQPEFI